MTASSRRWDGFRLTAAGYEALGERPPAHEAPRPRPGTPVPAEYELTLLGWIAGLGLDRVHRSDQHRGAGADA